MRNVQVNHLSRAHTFNPTITPRFRCSLFTRMRGFKFTAPLYAFMTVDCIEAGSVLRTADSYSASRPALNVDKRAPPLTEQSLKTRTSQELVLQWCKKTYRLVLQMCVQHLLPSVAELPRYRVSLVTTDMRRLTTGIRSEKCVIRTFRRCANVYLHKPRQYNIAYYTLRLYGIAYCSWATNLYSMYWILYAIVTQWCYNIIL